MKKIQTHYKLTENTNLIVNEETSRHISLVQHGEPCSGILRYWGTKDSIINELQEIIDKLRQSKWE